MRAIQWFIFFCLPVTLVADYRIEGYLHISEAWAPRVYLSAINSYDDLNAVSEDFILNSASLKEDGSFVLIGNNLPPEPRLYRLHICKKGDPPATIIIGGKEENHVHFVMNGESKLVLTNKGNDLFKDLKIQNDNANEVLWKLKRLIKNWKSKGGASSQISREYDFIQYQNDLRNFSDTCQIEVVTFLAIHYLDMQTDFQKQADFYKKSYRKWHRKGAQSHYFQAFEQQLSFLTFQDRDSSDALSKWMLGGFLMIIISLGIIYYQRKQGQTNKRHKKTIEHLSIQERRVFQFLVQGKTNKEISNELNIGISTVKSHVHNIFSKLNVKSRKEIARFESITSST